MCGIAGIVSQDGQLPPEQMLELAQSMASAMSHRGPDDHGAWLDPTGRCALAHRRLSVLDLSPEARQPLLNEDKTCGLSFNGEIYNFLDLRPRLEAQGHRFRSRTDGEVILHFLEGKQKPDAMEKLEGMFGFAFWDSRKRRLIMARDPFGKKPLYYARGKGRLAFASELQPLRLMPGFDDSLDQESIAQYLLLQYIHAPRSFYRGARKLPPGCCLFYEADGSLRIERYTGFRPGAVSPPYDTYPRASRRPWRRILGKLGRSAARIHPPRVSGSQVKTPRPQRVEQLRGLLIEAVGDRLLSDVPLGAFLSGGVDSSLVVGIMVKELGLTPDTFSIGFAGCSDSEHVYARQVAEHLGTRHHEQVLSPDILELSSEAVRAMDEPNGDTSCLPTLLLSRFARNKVTVALSGDGGDELFFGYGRYFQTIADLRGSWLQSVSNYYLTHRYLVFLPSEVEALLGALPPETNRLLASWADMLDKRGGRIEDKLRALDAYAYLPGAVLAKVDRMSMRYALEVRSPLLDARVARFAAGLKPEECFGGGVQGKILLKAVASRYLPAAWLMRPKMGFGLPMDFWRPAQLVTLAQELLLASDARTASFLDRAQVKTFLQKQKQAESFSVYQTWPLLLMEMWLRDKERPIS